MTDLHFPIWFNLTSSGKTLVVVYAVPAQDYLIERIRSAFGEPEYEGWGEENSLTYLMLFAHQDVGDDLREVAEKMTIHSQLRFLGAPELADRVEGLFDESETPSPGNDRVPANIKAYPVSCLENAPDELANQAFFFVDTTQIIELGNLVFGFKNGQLAAWRVEAGRAEGDVFFGRIFQSQGHARKL